MECVVAEVNFLVRLKTSNPPYRVSGNADSVTVEARRAAANFVPRSTTPSEQLIGVHVDRQKEYKTSIFLPIR